MPGMFMRLRYQSDYLQYASLCFVTTSKKAKTVPAMKTKVLEEKDLTGSIAVVVGTRPGIVKFSPVIRELSKKDCEFFIIHTGQHYSYNMDRVFFDSLELPDPLFTNDHVRNFATHGGQTAEMIKGVEYACINARPSVVIVGGDANTNIAAALAARKLVSIKVIHMEAGLRSHDWKMPEEHNRVMIDHISDVLLAPTLLAKRNLEHEGVQGKIFYTGNTIVDAVRQNIQIAKRKSNILSKIGNLPYSLVTFHREENVDHLEKLSSIVSAIEDIKKKHGLNVVFSCHPRTDQRLRQFGLMKLLAAIRTLKIIEPVNYLDFLVLMANAKIILTDSGGIQEESCILKVPCVTLRENTERPETLEVGSNIIVGTNPEDIHNGIARSLSSETDWQNPFGDGMASKRIADILIEYAKKTK
jgi:UDP-N-acetylglucosamine 2-epimerase (non-hydrolysing)